MTDQEIRAMFEFWYDPCKAGRDTTLAKQPEDDRFYESNGTEAQWRAYRAGHLQAQHDAVNGIFAEAVDLLKSTAPLLAPDVSKTSHDEYHKSCLDFESRRDALLAKLEAKP